MRLRERARIETAVQRVGWWLDWWLMPGRRRREVLRELRASLAAADVGDRPLTSFREQEGRIVASGTLLTWLHVAAIAAAFGLFARPWRALRRTAAQETVRAHG